MAFIFGSVPNTGNKNFKGIYLFATQKDKCQEKVWKKVSFWLFGIDSLQYFIQPLFFAVVTGESNAVINFKKVVLITRVGI